MTKQVDNNPTLRDFAPSIFGLAITSIALGLLTEWMLARQERFPMYMMFAGFVYAVFDLSIAWLVFGGGSYWLRLPAIILLTVGLCYLLSRTFPQTAAVALGTLLLRTLLIGLPLLIMRLRGARLVHRSDPPNKQRGSLQFSLASLLTLFTTAAIFLVAGRFAEFSRGDLFRIIVFSISTFPTIVALLAAWSHRRVSLKVIATIVITLLVGMLLGLFSDFGFDVVLMMMLGALVVTVITTVLIMRLTGYRMADQSDAPV